MLHDARDHIRRTSRPLRLGALVLLIALASTVVGCPDTYEPDERSTDDRARTGAQQIPLRRSVTDAVNYDWGDATDWKQFEAPGAGPMTIEVYFDNAFVKADVGLYDSYGTRLAQQSRTSGSDPIRIVQNLPGAGLFFIQIHASENRSVYSIRVYPGSGDTDTDQVVDPRPEFDRPI